MMVEPQNIVGDYAGTDELLALAQSGSLGGFRPIRVLRSGRIGPLVELASARRLHPAVYARVTAEAPFAKALERAIGDGAICGLQRSARFGVFPLVHLGPDGDPSDQWTLWFSRADQAARSAGFTNLTAAMIMGAFGELQDNVFRHSQAYSSGVVAFAITRDGFELVVSDRGVGVLGSLRTHPDYADLRDAGAPCGMRSQTESRDSDGIAAAAWGSARSFAPSPIRTAIYAFAAMTTSWIFAATVPRCRDSSRSAIRLRCPASP